ILSRHVSEEDLSNAGGVADRSRCLARRIQSAAAPSGALVLWQNPDADIRGQCAVGEGENLSGVTLVRTRCLSGEVLSYTPQVFFVTRQIQMFKRNASSFCGGYYDSLSCAL